ncbi:C39 family peptidase [Marinilabilia salmonicolor]|uniref:C39 family peptidase n=1 Tax=Marinilabilia salmonicolor TaxID=989 RepID=UPI00029A6077|nr:C39 family peptidase [Marinilabilia salmonicolor]
MENRHFVSILSQPDDSTCGPTSLHAVYRYLGENLSLDEVVKSVNYLPDGGTLAVMLGMDALRRGLKTRIYSYNLKMFDPSWEHLPSDELIERLELQLRYKQGKKFYQATRAYQQYLHMDGEIVFEDLNRSIFERYLHRGIPVLTGLSATYLYNSKREYTDYKDRSVYHDLKGEPMGHFVVLSGMMGEDVFIADPYKENPISGDNYYQVNIHRLINSILLGIVTYDANMLIVMKE